MQRASTIWTPLLIVESPKCYPSGKGKTMELLKDFLIDDIKIPAEFKTTEPGAKKIARAEGRYSRTGTLPTAIIVNDDNMLIDGYITYLLAVKHNIKRFDVYRGYYETISAVHGHCSNAFDWEVPAALIGKIEVGDKVSVITKRGVRKVRVVGVMRQQCPEYGKKLQRVLRIERKGRLYGNGQERAEASKRYTPEVQ